MQVSCASYSTYDNFFHETKISNGLNTTYSQKNEALFLSNFFNFKNRFSEDIPKTSGMASMYRLTV